MTDAITIWDKSVRWRLIESAARDLMDLYDTPLPTLPDGTTDDSSAAVMARGSDIQEAERRLRAALRSLPTPHAALRENGR